MNLFEYSESVRKKEEGLNSVSFNNQDYLSKARTVAHYMTASTDSVVDNPNLHAVRDDLKKSIEEGQKALAIVESAIAKMEDKNETQFD